MLIELIWASKNLFYDTKFLINSIYQSHLATSEGALVYEGPNEIDRFFKTKNTSCLFCDKKTHYTVSFLLILFISSTINVEIFGTPFLAKIEKY